MRSAVERMAPTCNFVLSVLWGSHVSVLGFGLKKAKGLSAVVGLRSMIVTKTGEPASVLEENRFRDLVPVEQVANLNRIMLVSLVPIGILWIFGFLWSWVRSGFRDAA